ncbi:MAG: hypothetical protein QM751_15605 [Paludibacteraceae bacterium]
MQTVEEIAVTNKRSYRQKHRRFHQSQQALRWVLRSNIGGTIIVDRGGDPNPNSQIPVGNGAYVFIALISLYSTYKWGRKK